MSLLVKKLDVEAKLPTVSNPGEDLGFDLYALENSLLPVNKAFAIRTGISARFIDDSHPEKHHGLIFKDRSSMAKSNITVSGGVIDAGYTGELLVLLTNHNSVPHVIQKGDKIVQMLPIQIKTNTAIIEVMELPVSSRKDLGFGSSGR